MAVGGNSDIMGKKSLIFALKHMFIRILIEKTGGNLAVTCR